MTLIGPLGVKPFPNVMTLIRRSFTPADSFLPCESPVVNHPNPNLTPKLLGSPEDPIEHSFVPFRPKSPKHNALQKHPNPTNFFVPPRHSMTKNAMLPGER
jgi:hypothetical protein